MQYDLMAFIDMNYNVSITGGPDSNDYINSFIVDVVSGVNPTLNIASWEKLP